MDDPTVAQRTLRRAQEPGEASPEARAPERKRRRYTEQELVDAIREDERRLGRPLSQREREAFARGFFGQEYADDLRWRSPVEERELGCPGCGHTWYADGGAEHGAWLPASEDDLYCPACGVEGEA
jgi:hypothetical protein